MSSTFIARKKSSLNKRNWLAGMFGKTGSGKSLSALGICIAVDPMFRIKQVVYTAQQFMNVVDDLDKGQMVLWDEAGIDISNRDWYTARNKALNDVFQTFRERRLGCIFTVPSITFIDSKTQVLFHTFMETKSLIRSKGLCKVKVFKKEYNQRMKRDIYPYPKYYKFGKKVQLRYLYVLMPPKKLVNQYVKTSNDFKAEVRKKTRDTLKVLNIKDSRRLGVTEMFRILLDEGNILEKYQIQTRRGMIFGIPKLQSRFDGLSRTDAYELKNLLENAQIKGEL